MAYLLYSISFVSLVLATVLYLLRNRLPNPGLNIPLPTLPRAIYTRLPTSFTQDIESGLSSSTFDLSANVADNDSRAGLDTKGKKEIQKIMKNRGVGFDEARRVWMQIRFREEGIGEDGKPKDPKFFSFS